MSPRQRAFLAAFREVGNVRLACEVAKVGRSTHYRWIGEDLKYRKAVELAKEEAGDILEAEVFRRAVEGVEKPIGWYKGQPGGYVREYSDTLLIFYLKALRPDKYRERVKMRGTLANIDLTKLPDEQLARIAAGEHPFSVLAPGQGGAAVPMLESGDAVEAGHDETVRDRSRDVTRNSRDVEDE